MQTRVLIIDDRHSLVWFIQRILQQAGYDVISAYDGTDGLRKARQEKPDLIILDTVMPRMNGFEVYHQLQMDNDTSGIPVLFLTIEEGLDKKKLEVPQPRRLRRNSRPQRRPDNTGEAITDFLTKPFTAEQITAKVRTMLQSSQSGAEQATTNAGKPLILIVDDARSLVLLAERTLQKEGYDVVTAYDGLDGLQKVRDEKPDLIILDIVMPGLDGIQALKFIRKYSGTPILMLTSESEISIVKKALDLGADGYIVKPVSTTALVTRVREKLGDSRVAVA